MEKRFKTLSVYVKIPKLELCLFNFWVDQVGFREDVKRMELETVIITFCGGQKSNAIIEFKA